VDRLGRKVSPTWHPVDSPSSELDTVDPGPVQRPGQGAATFFHPGRPPGGAPIQGKGLTRAERTESEQSETPRGEWVHFLAGATAVPGVRQGKATLCLAELERKRGNGPTSPRKSRCIPPTRPALLRAWPRGIRTPSWRASGPSGISTSDSSPSASSRTS